jgi:hypothetical protein
MVARDRRECLGLVDWRRSANGIAAQGSTVDGTGVSVNLDRMTIRRFTRLAAIAIIVVAWSLMLLLHFHILDWGQAG